VVDEADVTALDKKRREYARVLGATQPPAVVISPSAALAQHAR